MNGQQATADGAPRDSRRLRIFLYGAAAIGPFSLNVYKPCLPWIQAAFDAPMAHVQLSLSLSILAAAAATLLCGPAADHWGRRPVLLGSLILYLAGSVAGALAPSLAMLVAGRIVQAAASSMALVMARAVIHDTHGESGSAIVIARASLSAVVLVVLAPVLGGILIDASGWRMVFWSTAAVGLVLLILGRGLLRESAPASARGASSLSRARIAELLRSCPFHGYALQSALHFAIFFAFTSVASFVMVNRLEQSATSYGLWFVLLAVFVGAGLKLAEHLAGRIATGRLAAFGSALVLGGSVLSAWRLSGSFGVLDLFLPATITGFGIGLAVPATNAGSMNAVPQLAGTASGLLGFEQYVAAAVFAQVVAADEQRAPVVLGVLSVVGGTAAVASSMMSWRHGGLAAPGPVPPQGETPA